jgi:7,8-dihydropterin-6-yl-methyl-4-(beta-D-ribofuranosyl)aminobenzene 5'-phosphate synthase
MRRTTTLTLLLILCACQPTATHSIPSQVPSTDVTGIASPISPTNTPENPTPTSNPTLTSPTDTPMVETETSMEKSSLTITILYNNVGYDPALETSWGFAAFLERNGETLLFDTGGDGAILMRNIAALNVDPVRIQGVVLSHIHEDHVGGLKALLNTGIQPTIYIPPSFPTNYKNSLKQIAPIIEVEPGQTIMEGILTTGELGTSIPEQALIVRTTKGMVIITGCAHPGIVQMVEHAIGLTGDPVYLVTGGFHLGSASNTQITSILEAFRRMGVQKVAPSHCTGDKAIRMFREEFGDDFIESGVGCVIIIEP